MHLLMTTFAFLIIFSIFSYAQLQKLKEDGITGSIYAGCFEKSIDELAGKLRKKAYYVHQKLDSNKKSSQEHKERLHSYLYIASLIQQPDTQPQETAESKAAYTLLKSTIFALYKNKAFFIEAEMDEAKVDNLLAMLFLNAKDLPIKNFVKSPESLANVPLNNKIYEGVLYKMLKGNTPPNAAADAPFINPENYKSLTHFIRFNKANSIISVYLAPVEILIALFKDPKIVEQVITARDEVFKEQQKEKSADKQTSPNNVPVQNTDLDARKLAFEKFRDLIRDDIDKTLVDFNISLTNPDDGNKDD